VVGSSPTFFLEGVTPGECARCLLRDFDDLQSSICTGASGVHEAPADAGDENIFDIQSGEASRFSRAVSSPRCRLRRADLWCPRQSSSTTLRRTG
jgi:hypothetical protein